jgi:hypothetical protein
MERTRLDHRQAKLVQPLAHRALVHLHRKAPCDLALQVDAAPAHNLVPRRIRPRQHQGFQFRLLRVVQQGSLAGALARAQPLDPGRIVAMNPITEGLPIHAGLGRCPLPRLPLQHHGERQQTARLRHILAGAGRLSKISG